MTVKRRIAHTASLVLLVGAVACDDGAITIVERQMTPTEVGQFLQVLADVGSFDPGATASAPQGVAGPLPVPFSHEVEWSLACPEGGSISASGSLMGDTEGDSGGLEGEYSATIAYDDCRATPDQGSSFEVDGGLNIMLDFEATGEGFAIQGMHSGTLTWSSGGRAGLCPINVSYSGSKIGSSQSAAVSGTVCGVSVNQTVTSG